MSSPAKYTRCLHPDHATAPDTCSACADLAEKEVVRYRDLWQRILNERSDHDTATYAAARRRVIDDLRRHASFFMHELLQEDRFIGTVMRRAVGSATMIDPAWGRTQEHRERLEYIRANAVDGQAELRKVLGEDLGKVTGAAKAWTEEPALKENARLRELIMSAGRTIHAAEGTDGPCRCTGCELIITMDAPADGEAA